MPTITSSKQSTYKTFQTICLLRTYRQARIDTITIIIAVATACIAWTITNWTSTQLKINDTTYKSATATRVYMLILLRLQTEEDLLEEELDVFFVFVDLAIFNLLKIYYIKFCLNIKTLFKRLCCFVKSFRRIRNCRLYWELFLDWFRQ